jgi:hypothetical protein
MYKHLQTGKGREERREKEGGLNGTGKSRMKVSNQCEDNYKRKKKSRTIVTLIQITNKYIYIYIK